MALKNILVPLTGLKSDACALNAALDLAKQHAAHVTGLYVRIPMSDAVPIVGDGATAVMYGDLVSAFEQQAKQLEAASRTMFDAAVKASGVAAVARPDEADLTQASAALAIESGHELPTLVRACALADLVVVAAHTDPDEQPMELTENLESALLEGGRPVLVVPRGVAGPIGRKVCIAWNRSTEGARAVSGALPILAMADVTVLTAATAKTDPKLGEGMVAFLGWHGIKAVRRRVDVTTQEVGQALLAEATALGADLLVMGAYTHSRLRQLFLGGVTKTVLTEAKIPVLMAH
jgi:nucleotide-binding universal stress UspA family protein